MAEAFLQVVLENLNSLIQNELGLLWDVNKQMQKLSSTLSTIQAVLEDAEEKQIRDKAIQNWLRKLKDAAYDVNDVLDEFATEASRLQYDTTRSGSRINKACTSLGTCFYPNVMFRHKIANRMKVVGERLDEIAEERMKFHLRETRVAERRVEAMESCQTGSIPTVPVVYGREYDRERIVEYLLKDASASDNDVSVYAIVGMGGIGKTTLAQLVFNDERIRAHFDLAIWVCISDDFDVKRVMKSIIESASGIACEALELDSLQRRLQEMLKTKKYLIVLDDVWNENQEKWDRLKYVIACGSKGASIIVTTRLHKVASIVGTVSPHHLSGLCDQDCWSLFSQRAFADGTGQEAPNLAAIGKEIVRQCGGVPLAAKALGGLMRFKRGEIQWLHVKESELWNLPQDEYSVLPALRLSYCNLPLKLRQCFAYCAVFPKDHVMERELLIHLWIANGFISSDGKLEAEDVGDEVCYELCSRSLIQAASFSEFGKTEYFRMHDLVHDLALSVMDDECHTLEPETSNNLSRRTRHLTIRYSKQSFSIPDSVSKLESLHTLVLQQTDRLLYRQAFKFSSDLSKFNSLRVLVAIHSGLTSLPSSVGNLKHLRYLDLSSTRIRALPRSICNLWNLQILRLVFCTALQWLPSQISLLRNIRHLCINGCHSLSYLPPKIGQLTCLKTLSTFIVGRRRGCHLAELQGLDLRGELSIRHLERVRSPVDAKKANLSCKGHLCRLRLCWESNGESEPPEHVEKVLESLEPHPNLKSLSIKGYGGIHFPNWLGEPVHSNLVSISLHDCNNCVDLPPLGKLPSLRNLSLVAMKSIQCLDNEKYEAGAFPSLKTLSISDFPRLERFPRDEGRDLFPHLAKLSIDHCPKLSLPNLTSLKNLSIRKCNEVVFNSISNLSGLSVLSIEENDDLISFPVGMLRNLTSLQTLVIKSFSKLQALPEGLAGLTALDSLYVTNCNELKSSPEQGLRDLHFLRNLHIDNCSKLKLLSEGIRHLTSLRELSISGCPGLPAVADDMEHLVSLRRLSLSGSLNIFQGLSANPSDGAELAKLPEALGQVPALQYLSIKNYPNLTSLPISLGNLTPLRELSVLDCAKLTSIPTIKNLTNLKYLRITGCPQLVRRLNKQTGEDWHMIAHIPLVHLDQ